MEKYNALVELSSCRAGKESVVEFVKSNFKWPHISLNNLAVHDSPLADAKAGMLVRFAENNFPRSRELTVG